MSEGYGPEWQDNPDRRSGGGSNDQLGCIMLIIMVIMAIVGGIVFMVTTIGDNPSSVNSRQNDYSYHDAPNPPSYPEPDYPSPPPDYYDNFDYPEPDWV